MRGWVIRFTTSVFLFAKKFFFFAKYTIKQPSFWYILLKPQRQTFHQLSPLSGESVTQKPFPVLKWKRWILLCPLEHGWLWQQHHRQSALPNLREPRLPVQKSACQQRSHWSLSTTTASSKMYAERWTPNTETVHRMAGVINVLSYDLSAAQNKYIFWFSN